MRLISAVPCGGLSLMLAAGAVALSSSMLVAPAAWAQDGVFEAVGQRCQAQYPAGGGYSQGIPYLAPPGNVDSWRCKQVSLSGAGAITDLPVDLAGIIG